ncbi:MAG TPA: penicillin-binding protein 2, partial [Pyrinomonadaceae bacterium]|nr:penicillin-binding protein 2 [Pyrinomonadaceae bacterium]
MSAMLARLSAETKIRPDASIRRALFVAAFIVFWVFAISVRLVYLQVSQHEALGERARSQQQQELETSSQRGLLLDRQERELARSIQTESIFIDAAKLENAGDIECTAARLAPVLQVKKEDLQRKIADAKTKNSRFVWIARRLSAEQATAIRGLGLPGVDFRSEPKRFYPNGSIAAHVLGFVGVDGAGLGGVEQFYNEKITGEPGKLFLERDSEGNPYESFEQPGTPGQTIVLTLDHSIQYRAEQALLSAVTKSRAKSGTAIVLDPRSGEILALANAPTFDPNKPGEAKAEARSNWALQNIYEPGSTFKIVSFSAAIEKGLAKPDDRIDCQMGAITVAGRLVHDHHAFGSLTITEALAKSSNVAAIKLGMRVGDATMYEYMKRFGFGSRTGIELPGETAGLLRPVSRWQPSSIGSIAIGQEVGVTPLQMAAAFGALANDGVRIAPHLVREVRTASGATVYRANPEQRRVVNVETARALRQMLESVTLNGTAKLAQLNGYSAAGKTGTAQKIDPKTKTYSRTKHVASFVGFAPVNDPALVIIVVIDEPGGAYHGGDVAAPVFRDIAEQILPDLGVVPDTYFKLPDGLVAEAATPEVAPRSREAEVQTELAREATLPSVAGRDGHGGEIVYAAANKSSILMPDLSGRSVRDVARTCARLGLK